MIEAPCEPYGEVTARTPRGSGGNPAVAAEAQLSGNCRQCGGHVRLVVELSENKRE
jgi:hypothetical protein